MFHHEIHPMSPEHRASNIRSWTEIGCFIESFPDPSWSDWKALARRFIRYGLDRNFDRHFRIGQSMARFVLSTLDHNRLRDEPSVLITLIPPGTLKLSYRPAIPASLGDTSLEYDLGFEQAMPTLQRFLNHLWEVTMPEPLPPEMRAPEHTFNAPILTTDPPPQALDQKPATRFSA